MMEPTAATTYSSGARVFGHPLIELYAAAMCKRGTLRTDGATDDGDESTEGGAERRFLSTALELLEARGSRQSANVTAGRRNCCVRSRSRIV